MKQQQLLLAIAVLLTLGVTSCNKEDNAEGARLTRFHATCEPNSTASKIYLSGTTPHFSPNDSARLWGSNDTFGYIYKVMSDETTYVDFLYDGPGAAPVLNGPYVMGCPARFWNEKNVVTLPSTQKYMTVGANDIPMYSYVDSTAMPSLVYFYNVCAMVRLRLMRPSTSVSSISITTDVPVYGDFVATTQALSDSTQHGYGHIPSFAYRGNGGNTITLNCSTPQSIDSTKDFDIYIPANTYSRFVITVTTSDNHTITKSAPVPLDIRRSQMITLLMKIDDVPFDQRLL